MDAFGAQVVFTTIKNYSDSSFQKAICLYRFNAEHPAILATDKEKSIVGRWAIGNKIPTFSPSGEYIVFDLVPVSKLDLRKSRIKLDIWSYKDSVLQSSQLLSMTSPMIWKALDYKLSSSFFAALDISSGHVVKIENEDEDVLLQPDSNANYVVLADKFSIDEKWWPTERSTYLVSLRDGDRVRLCAGLRCGTNFSFSPSGKYLVYFDNNSNSYWSCNLQTKERVNLSRPISDNKHDGTASSISMVPLDVAGWTVGNESVLLYDDYDIWQTDLRGVKLPINVTNGFGRENNLKFRIISDYEPKKNLGNSLMLVAFDVKTKENGFYKVDFLRRSNPRKLLMEPAYYSNLSHNENWTQFNYLKAREDDLWIFCKQTSTTAPNFYVTKDFKKVNRLTNIQSQTAFNWLRSELVEWTQFDGRVSQGVLHKPEDFNAKIKYPVIIKYYTTASDDLFQYRSPHLMGTDISISWFVSRGYLVFEPDIFYGPNVGRGIVNSVVSAAANLAKLPWVDSSRIAINGHSFGGYETNLLITNSKIFAAAVSGAGIADCINQYNDILPVFYKEKAGHDSYEGGQMAMKNTLWESKDLYIEVSPIFNADKVSTPLLMMHNKGDQVVTWHQSVEFFSALRRLNKKVWLLQYDKGAHGLYDNDEMIDYTSRVTQFFDHYLKGYPPPKWMTQGRPAKLRQIEDRFEFDPSSSCGHSCKICQQKSYQHLEILDVMNPNGPKYHVDANLNVRKK